MEGPGTESTAAYKQDGNDASKGPEVILVACAFCKDAVKKPSDTFHLLCHNPFGEGSSVNLELSSASSL